MSDMSSLDLVQWADMSSQSSQFTHGLISDHGNSLIREGVLYRLNTPAHMWGVISQHRPEGLRPMIIPTNQQQKQQTVFL